MPGPKLPEYPKPMYRGDTEPTYARDEKHEDKLASEGWSASYIPKAYPKMLFWPNVNKKCKVFSMDEEVVALESGWSTESQRCHYEDNDTKPNMPLPTTPPAGVGPTADQFAQLQEMFMEQQKLINSLLLEKAGGDDEAPSRRARK